jgi:hypothetical protein
MASFSVWNDWNVGVTGRTRHSGYEAAGVPRYGMDMIADGLPFSPRRTASRLMTRAADAAPPEAALSAFDLHPIRLCL